MFPGDGGVVQFSFDKNESQPPSPETIYNSGKAPGFLSVYLVLTLFCRLNLQIILNIHYQTELR